MTAHKDDPSPRTVRRWIAGTAVALVAQSVVTLIWAVDPAQRVVSVAFSLLAAALVWRVLRMIPNSAVRPERHVPDDVRRGRDALVQGLWAAVPVVFGGIMTQLLPGDPTGWMQNGVRISAGLAAIAISVLLRRWYRRRRRVSAR